MGASISVCRRCDRTGVSDHTHAGQTLDKLIEAKDHSQVRKQQLVDEHAGIKEHEHLAEELKQLTALAQQASSLLAAMKQHAVNKTAATTANLRELREIEQVAHGLPVAAAGHSFVDEYAHWDKHLGEHVR